MPGRPQEYRVIKSILFIQHAGVMGGSATSLRHLIQALDPSEYRATVCLLRPSQDVVDYYAAHHIPSFVNQHILPLPHTSGTWLHFADPLSSAIVVQGLLRWRTSVRETKRLVETHPCDLVHVNSSILLPSAVALHRLGRKFVWHVREAPQPKYFGTRLQIFRRALRTLPSERVFLSQSDRRGWMGSDRCGVVIPHSVDQKFFALDEKCETVQNQLGVSRKPMYILYVGGLSQIKGIFVLLRALHLLARDGMEFICLMPGALRVRGQSLRSRIGRGLLRATTGGTDEMKAHDMIVRYGLAPRLHMLPFQTDLTMLFAKADVLVFPATVPHFAVPVLEAAAAGVPVLASDFEVMHELIDDPHTGLRVPPSDPRALADALAMLAADPQRRKQMGASARARARQLYRHQHEGEQFMQVYERVLQAGKAVE